MTSTQQRYLTGFIAVPALLVIILFLPHQNHLAFNIVVILACLAGSWEMRDILTSGMDDKRLPLPFWAGALLPLAAYTEYSLGDDTSVILYTLIFLMSLACLSETITGHHDNFAGTRVRISLCFANIIYPNLFSIFFVRICFFETAWMWLLTFFLLVFSCDTFAYFFGRWFGKNNKGIVKVSPNKSVAGFIAGALVPALIMTLMVTFIDAYGIHWWEGCIIGLATSCAGICGDLIESAFKRSAGVKDSGKLVPGRGGVLDSIDSLAIAAPIYVALLHLFQVFI